MDIVKKADEFRKVLQFSYCCSYDKYREVFGVWDNYYHRDKYNKMVNNFSKWYCELDSANAVKFINAALEKQND